MGVAVQASNVPRGAVLVVGTSRRHPEREGHTDQPVTPEEVVRCIRAALADGWAPREPGSTFYLPAEYNPLWNDEEAQRRRWWREDGRLPAAGA